MRPIHRYVALAAVAWSVPAAAQSPLLPVQGRLREATQGALVNGARNVTFRLYGQLDGGAAFFEVTKEVTFADGRFLTYLGEQLPIPIDQFDGLPAAYLGITVAPETVEMSPRVRLGASPFAVYAQLCGETTNADSAARASVADDIECSECVQSEELAESVQAQFAARVHSHVLSDIDDIDDSVIQLGTIPAPELRSVPGGGTLCSQPPLAARFCALDKVDIRHTAGGAVGSRCYISESNGLWQICGTTFNADNRLNCSMRCIE